jgi:hypothetical protein
MLHLVSEQTGQGSCPTREYIRSEFFYIDMPFKCRLNNNSKICADDMWILPRNFKPKVQWNVLQEIIEFHRHSFNKWQIQINASICKGILKMQNLLSQASAWNTTLQLQHTMQKWGQIYLSHIRWKITLQVAYTMFAGGSHRRQAS